jgi:hypothetical protein
VVPETTMGQFLRFSVRLTVAMGAMRFMKARVTTEVTSPI